MDSCITQLKAQGPSRTSNESNEEEIGSDIGKDAYLRGQMDTEGFCTSKVCALSMLDDRLRVQGLQGYLAHKKLPPP